MIQIKEKSADGIIRYKPVTKICDDVRDSAREKFKTFHEKGTILNDNFGDTEWRLTDQKGHYSFNFGYREEELGALARDRGKSRLTFINDLKTYVSLTIGTASFEDIRALVKYSIDEVIKSEFFTTGAVPSGIQHGGPLLSYIGFLNLLKGQYVPDDYIRLCNDTYTAYSTAEKNDSHDSQPVTLNEFRSYFLLSDVLDEYWFSQRDAGTPWKQYFYPFYLFWRVTTILPLRVTESCVTPHNCISTKDGRYYLTIRRSRLKGSSHRDPKIRDYTLDKDYTLHTYEIIKDIYNSIKRYQEITECFTHPYGTLFSVDHLLSLGVGTLRTADKNKVFGSLELNTLIKDFFDHVVCEMFQLTVVDDAALMRRAYDDENGIYEMEDDEIMIPQAKHTRHLAMINLIMRGCNPMLIKEFAGHEKVQTSEHYYSNVVRMVRCSTKYFYDKAKAESTGIDVKNVLYKQRFDPASVLNDSTSKQTTRVDGGTCDANCSDCAASGYDCARCPHFTPDAEDLPEYKEETKRLEKKTEEEMKFLRRLMTCPELEEKMSTLQIEAQKAMSDLSGLAVRYFKEFEAEGGRAYVAPD